ncbi:hypothetical protein NUW54_g10688 [Trametes sanguinea]|uniref:Uncharacterized protein n=1 Tax=Trametes sanguinea TaxID=158606 RepID=A0ACC1NX96_9APHY|nr:hypothetical protein NUW54_g10688 [Trametes sanguinea]
MVRGIREVLPRGQRVAPTPPQTAVDRCERLPPGPGCLEALGTHKVTYPFLRRVLELTRGHHRLTSSLPPSSVSQRTASKPQGKHEDLDVIFCTTGGSCIQVDVASGDVLLGRGRWIPEHAPIAQAQRERRDRLSPRYHVAYAVQAIAKLQGERLKSIDVKPEGFRDFDQYIEAYFPKVGPSIYGEKCRSWSKMGKEEGRIVGLLLGISRYHMVCPCLQLTADDIGPSLHTMRALSHLRWEDYNYDSVDPVDNRLHWLGDGQTVAEIMMSGDRVWYLREPFLEVPPVPEDLICAE